MTEFSRLSPQLYRSKSAFHNIFGFPQATTKQLANDLDSRDLIIVMNLVECLRKSTHMNSSKIACIMLHSNRNRCKWKQTNQVSRSTVFNSNFHNLLSNWSRRISYLPNWMSRTTQIHILRTVFARKCI